MKIVRYILGVILLLACLTVLTGVSASMISKEANTAMILSLAGSILLGIFTFFATFKPQKWMGILFMPISIIPLFMPDFSYEPGKYLAGTAFVFVFGLSIILSKKSIKKIVK